MKPTAPDPSVIRQVALVVPRLEAAMHGFWETTHIGPWKVFTNSSPPLSCIYYDRPVNYKVRVAIAMSGQVQMELIEYIEGDTLHRDFIASGRQGLEHVGVFVPDLDEALKPYLDQGIQIIQKVDGMGASQDGRYAYLDTEKLFGTVLELIQAASQPAVPELIYP